MAWLQFQLNQNGALLAVDGILGKKTLIAVAAYHDANGHEGYEKKLRPGPLRETTRGSPSMSKNSEILDSN